MKFRNFIFILIFVVLIAGILVARHLTADRIEDIPDGYIGNTAGNLNNGGYFCTSDGMVYFANFYDNGTLYCMNADETEIVKLHNQSVKFINVAGTHIYYFLAENRNGTDLGSVIRSSGLYRCSTNGKNVDCLKRGVMDSLLLTGNRIYYQYYDKESGFSLYRISTTGTDDTQVTETITNPACGNGTLIYFNGTSEDHNLYTLDTTSDRITRIWEGNMWNPVYSDGWIYYNDVGNGYRICRLNLSNGTVEIVTNMRAEFFNVSDRYVFFQTTDTDEPALMRVDKEGSNEVVIAYGIYNSLCLTDRYLYYTAYDSLTPVMYHCAIDSTFPEEFTAASEAAERETR